MQQILTEEKTIYIQIKEMIETEILKENLLEGDQAPSTNTLAKVYSINPNTAGKGIKLLTEEGVLYKKRGIGMFVAQGARQNIVKKRKGEFYDSYMKNLLYEAEMLGITKEDLIEMISEYKERGEER